MILKNSNKLRKKHNIRRSGTMDMSKNVNFEISSSETEDTEEEKEKEKKERNKILDLIEERNRRP